MERKYKPTALHCVWNVDLTISIFAGGKKMITLRGCDVRDSAESFIKGWFGDHPHKVRWSYPMSKKEKMERALAELNALVNNGREFPDVIGFVAKINKVSEEALTAAYDKQA